MLALRFFSYVKHNDTREKSNLETALVLNFVSNVPFGESYTGIDINVRVNFQKFSRHKTETFRKSVRIGKIFSGATL